MTNPKICCIRDGIEYEWNTCWLCKKQQEAIENDPEWAYHEGAFNVPMHDMYPLELDDEADNSYRRFLRQLTIDHMTLPYIDDEDETENSE